MANRKSCKSGRKRVTKRRKSRKSKKSKGRKKRCKRGKTKSGRCKKKPGRKKGSKRVSKKIRPLIYSKEHNVELNPYYNSLVRQSVMGKRCGSRSMLDCNSDPNCEIKRGRCRPMSRSRNVYQRYGPINRSIVI